MANYNESWNGAIFTKLNYSPTTGELQPQLIQNEPVTVFNNVAQLSQIPSEYHRVFIDGYTEVFDTDIIQPNQFKVAYNTTNLIWFNSADNGKMLTIKQYYGIGVQYISEARIMESTLDENGNPKLIGIDLKNMKEDLAKIKQDYENATHTTLVEFVDWEYVSPSDNTTTFSIAPSNYNPLIDDVTLYFRVTGNTDATVLIKDKAYTLSGSTITLKDWTLKKDEVIHVRLMRGINTIPPAGTDGGAVINGSITEPKLSVDLQQNIKEKIKIYTYNYIATTDNTSNFLISSSYYNPVVDKVKIYYKGILLKETDNYTLEGLRVNLGFTINKDEKIVYEIIKSLLPNSNPVQADGSMLMDNTVGRQKLSQDVQNDINKLSSVGNVSNLQTTYKTDIVGATNEVNTKIGDLTTLPTIDKSSVVSSINEINTSVDYISSVAYGANINTSINNLINLGKTKIKIPSGTFNITNPILLDNNVELWGNKDTILTTDQDINIIATKGVPGTAYSNIYLHDFQVQNTKTSGITKYQIDLINANMCRMERVQCLTQSTTNTDVGGLIIRTLGSFSQPSVYSLLMDKCDFRQSSIKILITDCYISNTNIWGNNRAFALHIGASSQQINNCQFVGGDTYGAVWVQDNVNNYDVEIIKINNCYFDGSYENIQSGIGLNAVKMRYSSIVGCTFWYQKKDGMLLDGCFGNVFDALVFEGNGRNNLTSGALNNSNGYADIRVKNSTYDNIFSNITFAANGSYYIKNKAILSDNATTLNDHLNKFSNLTVSDFNNYASNPIDISYSYLGFNNTAGTSQTLDNILSGNTEIKGDVVATGGFKQTLLFYKDNLTTNSSVACTFGGSQHRMIVLSSGSVLGVGVALDNAIVTGTLTIKVARNNDFANSVVGTAIIDSASSNKYYSISNYAKDLYKIYAQDLLSVAVITSSDFTTNGASNISVTLTIEN